MKPQQKKDAGVIPAKADQKLRNNKSLAILPQVHSGDSEPDVEMDE